MRNATVAPWMLLPRIFRCYSGRRWWTCATLLEVHDANIRITGEAAHVLVKVPARVLYGNYWARGKFEKVM